MKFGTVKPDGLQEEPFSILSAEYDYIANTANQANADRATVTSFFWTAIGSLAAVAALGSQIELDATILYRILAALLIFLSLLGWNILNQLMKLRVAWHGSVIAMNQIKDFYIYQMKKWDLDLSPAFMWRRRTCPKHYTPGNFSWWLATEIGTIGGMLFGAGVFFLLVGCKIEHINARDWWTYAIGVLFGVFYALSAFWWYRHKMSQEDVKEAQRLKHYPFRNI